ncbi:MAG: class I SAM-dependent methyltransferase [Candidatus Thermoplasmatota archaeon]|nr:class I SAM-dependent methyltransferase [Candidatus Thermoplasmatota archaeon]
MDKPDYGTYHHSSREDSEKLREAVKSMFNQAFERLQIDRQKPVSILDVGCGNGFLLSIAGMFYPRSMLTGIDSFSGSSLHGSSIALARKNMNILGIGERTTIREVDLLENKLPQGKFDLIISNLVLHNLGGRRFQAYSIIGDLLRGNGHFLNGDLFLQTSAFSDKFSRDMKKISNLFRVEFTIEPPVQSGSFMKYYRLVGLSKSI